MAARVRPREAAVTSSTAGRLTFQCVTGDGRAGLDLGSGAGALMSSMSSRWTAPADRPIVFPGASLTSSVDTSRSWRLTTRAPASVGASRWSDVSSIETEMRVTSLGSTSSKA